jgi:hypothetical protein
MQQLTRLFMMLCLSLQQHLAVSTTARRFLQA